MISAIQNINNYFTMASNWEFNISIISIYILYQLHESSYEQITTRGQGMNISETLVWRWLQQRGSFGRARLSGVASVHY